MEEEKEESTSDNMNGTIILSKPISQTLFESGILDILQDTSVKVQITPANLNETVTIESKVNDEVSGSDLSGPDISGIEELPRDSVVPELPQEATSLSPAVNNGLRRGTFTVDSNRAVAKVSPMVPERPKGKHF